MYGPAPPRLKKTNIVRSRYGCKNCRERRTKCDERKPTCRTCARLGKTCEVYRPEFRFCFVDAKVSKKRSKPLRKFENIHSLGQYVESKTAAEQSPTEQSLADRPSVGSLDIIKSLQHTERDVFYTTIWQDFCLPAMHPMFQALSRHCSEDSMLRDATLALSSCNFSRLHPDIKDTTNRYMGYFSPALVHQTRSQLYYSQAIRKFTALSEYECQNTPIVILTVLTIFAYIESSMGNFHGFNCHDQGMSSLLLNLNVSLKDPTLEALLAAWLQIRIVVWWGRAYFCSLQVLQHLPSALLPELLQDGSASPHRRRVTVLGIMCESHRLNFQRVLKHWEPTNTEVSEHQEHLGEVEDYTQTISKLAMQSSELDIWVSELPPSDLPIENHGHLEGSEMNLQENSIHFQSHEAALNYAYYVVGRIMQCTGLLEALRMNESPPSAHEFTEEEEWTLLLLRIVKGTDMQKSLTMNNYTIGFSGLLLTALLRCRSHSLGLEIQNWLQGLANLQSTEEGAFPLYQTLGVAKAINRQKEIYRDVLGATQPVDDDGGTPKFNAYNSQPISTLLFHGICKYSGALFSECVSIDI